MRSATIARLVLGGLLEKAARARVRDRAEVLGRLVVRHADAGVLDHEDAARAIDRDRDLRRHGLIERVLVDERGEARLVERVRSVGHQLAQEDLAVGVERVGDQPKHGGHLRLELTGLGGDDLVGHGGPAGRTLSPSLWQSRPRTRPRTGLSVGAPCPARR
jgi:hypothetical protein